MAQIPNTKLELHPSMFDLLMTVLAYNAANAPVESVRSGAKDLMEKRMRFTRLYMSKDGEQYASLCMYENEAEEMIWQLLLSEELERTTKNGYDRPAAQAEASTEDLNAVFDFLNSF